MKLTEYAKIVKKENQENIILVKFGNFYRCCDYDAIIVNYLLGYNVNEKISTGFPIKNLNFVLRMFKENNVSCVIITKTDNNLNYSCINNEYKFLLNKALENYNVNLGVSSMSILIREILKKDINKLHDIKLFLSNL